LVASGSGSDRRRGSGRWKETATSRHFGQKRETGSPQTFRPPSSTRGETRRPTWMPAPPLGDLALWRNRVAEKGWGTPAWPVEYGGGGLSPRAARVLAEEMARAGAFNPLHVGMGRNDDRADHPRHRHRRAEARASPTHRARHGSLVRGLFRNRRRLRSRVAADALRG